MLGVADEWTERHKLKITHQQTPAEAQFATHKALCTLNVLRATLRQ